MRNDAGDWEGDRNRLYELKFVYRLVSLHSSQTRGDRVDHTEIPLMQCETIGLNMDSMLKMLSLRCLNSLLFSRLPTRFSVLENI